jgi:carbamoyl-phosphate synthase large subunit
MNRYQLAKQFREKLKSTVAYLHFSNGTSFKGHINLESNDPRLENGIWGESAFTTSMSGYQETITDPSYLGQHIIFATSHVGNYSSSQLAMQSEFSHATSLIAKEFSYNKFLDSSDTPLFSGLDTRSLVKFLTTTDCSHKSVISINEKTPDKVAFEKNQLHCNDISRVTNSKPEVITKGDEPIVLINYGVKQSIVDSIKKLGFPLIVTGPDTSQEEIMSYKPRLVFLSNGPGDPALMQKQVKTISALLKQNVPMRAICMGHQLLSQALGAKTERLPFGHRGTNHPVLDHVTGDIIITSQNHGYAVEEDSLKSILTNNLANKEFVISHRSLFDLSIEGIASIDHLIKTVQFHPEANPGPQDAAFFFTEIKDYLDGIPGQTTIDPTSLHPITNVKDGLLSLEEKNITYKKIMLVGSGPIKIGQASEFDYSGTQACKALKEIGIDVVLLNSNPATIMTDPDMAYRTYIEPITKDCIKKIIKKEGVDAVISTMGGQTALNICIELEQENFFKENNVALLGANVDTITKTEDRSIFAEELKKLNYQTGRRFRATNKNEALTLANSKVGFPLIIRRDFALGGRGSALVYNDKELNTVFESTDIQFPIIIEKSLVGHKEVELEVMVDSEKNGVIICSIENVDPCGIHTGDSITVAPAQTLSDRCYQNLRTMSLTIAKHMGVVAGGANVQFAINPFDEDDIVVIEMNPRVSRSSALASKATGYPIAKISALLAIGYTLKEILNDITKASPVAFEPTLDYVAVKIPVFPFNKFPTSSQVLGPQMRSVGEVLALGTTFAEAFLKALKSLEMGLEVPSLTQLKTTPVELSVDYLSERLSEQRELSLLTCLEGLRKDMTIEEIYQLSKISPWFIEQMTIIKNCEDEIIAADDICSAKDKFFSYKQLGISDKYLALLTSKAQKEIFKYRVDNKIFPVYKAVDTCSGEFQAQTPYYYSAYADKESNEAIALSENERSIAILGSGPNRIGQGIEFDYSCVKSCKRLAEKSIKSIMVNSNPETVSTDYDSSDRLYLSALYSEDIFDILINEKPEGVITAFSGQTGIGIREHIENSFRKEFFDFKFLGPGLRTLDLTENRQLFSEILSQTTLSQTNSLEVRGQKNIIDAITELGLPVIVRPSYVIGGESMYIFNSPEDIKELPPELKESVKSQQITVQIENYLENAIEYDVDLIRDQHGNTVFAICEHIEYAGVHSGDSGMISPPVILSTKLYREMKEISEKLAEILEVLGPINFQYAVKDQKIYCIEANPRGSRTLPFLSKAYNKSLPCIATDAMLGETIANWDKEVAPFFCVKQSTFPFDRFIKDDIILGPKMRSTGETFGIDIDKDKAMLKSYLGNYPKLANTGKILISLTDTTKIILRPYLKSLYRLGFEFFATSGTAKFIQKQGIPCQVVSKISDEAQEANQSGEKILSISQILQDKETILVFNTPLNMGGSKSDGEFIRNMAIQFGIACFTRSENIKAVIESITGSHETPLEPYSLQEIHQIDNQESTSQTTSNEMRV